MKITYCFVHHTGGFRDSPFSKSSHLTLEQINEAHRQRWPDFKSQLDFWVGYTALIFPDGKIVQTRKVGEELAANKGYNSRSVAPCLLGNFSRRPDGLFVELPTLEQVETLRKVLIALHEKNPGAVGLQVVEGTEIDIPLQNFLPHRLAL
ncbi:MAG: N-acetylmuramoyl-L-alanine amidase [Candidatus Berkelbacteria bacterium]|nr:N-acetylmuramoyl-L-alanine amidase [Candidatus Berkelbacteria bacterium]